MKLRQLKTVILIILLTIINKIQVVATICNTNNMLPKPLFTNDEAMQLLLTIIAFFALIIAIVSATIYYIIKYIKKNKK